MRVVYFAPVAFGSFWQRPHWMVSTLLRRHIERVLWVEPYPTRLPALGDLRRPADRAPAAAELPAAIDRLAVHALPFEPWRVGRTVNRYVFFRRLIGRIQEWIGGRPYVVGVGKPSPLARLAIESVSSGYRGSFFDAMDHYPAFYRGASRAAMARWEVDCLETADRVQVSSCGLRERYERVRPDVVLVPNGYDSAIIRQAMVESAHTRSQASVFGYVGTLGPWFDWEWLMGLARVLAHVSPGAQIHLIGPSFAQPPMPLPPQVRLLGTMSNSEALRRAAGFEAGLIPFVRNELTDCVDPVKYYEYRALARPVIAAPFSDLATRRDPGLFITPNREADIDATLARAREFNAAPSVPGDLPEWEWDRRFAALAEWIDRPGRARSSKSMAACMAAG